MDSSQKLFVFLPLILPFLQFLFSLHLRKYKTSLSFVNLSLILDFIYSLTFNTDMALLWTIKHTHIDNTNNCAHKIVHTVPSRESPRAHLYTLFAFDNKISLYPLVIWEVKITVGFSVRVVVAWRLRNLGKLVSLYPGKKWVQIPGCKCKALYPKLLLSLNN